jgi:hypothetical protein
VVHYQSVGNLGVVCGADILGEDEALDSIFADVVATICSGEGFELGYLYREEFIVDRSRLFAFFQCGDDILHMWLSAHQPSFVGCVGYGHIENSWFRQRWHAHDASFR